MNDIIMNCKFKNGKQPRLRERPKGVFKYLHFNFSIPKGFATPVQTAAPVSPSKKQLSPDHPNPALPITEVGKQALTASPAAL